MTKPVCVMIPTFQRLNGLARAVGSIFAQDYTHEFELLIIDNDPSGSARETAEKLGAKAPGHIKFSYIHEPRAGVSNARNRGVAETQAQLIAFLDDDQSAPPHWLSQLMANYERFPAAVTFGPVLTVLPDNIVHHRAYFEDFFARKYDAKPGYIDAYFGCGNALLDIVQMPAIDPLFDTGHNETGGEDDVLFSHIQSAGGRFAWCADAPVNEHVPCERATLDYTLRRAFSYGQGPISRALRQNPPRWDKVLLWMGVGLIKALANGMAYIVLWVVRAPGRASYLDLAARGVGKLIWWPDLRFYGTSRLKNGPGDAPELG